MSASCTTTAAIKPTPKSRRPRYVNLRISSARERFDKLSGGVLLTEGETSEVTGFSPHTLKAWRLKGEGKGPPSLKVPGTDAVRYRAGTLQQWLANIPER
jgi:hypothetical protein